MKSIALRSFAETPPCNEAPEFSLCLRLALPANGAPVNARSTLRLAARAIESRGVCVISYGSEVGVPPVTRAIEPLAVIFGRKGSGIFAWCRLRGDLRTFLIDRIEAFAVTNERYFQHPDQALERFIRRRRHRRP